MGYDETFNIPILRLVLNNLTVVQMGRNTLETHLRQFHRPKTCAHNLYQLEDTLKKRTAEMRHYDTQRVPHFTEFRSLPWNPIVAVPTRQTIIRAVSARRPHIPAPYLLNNTLFSSRSSYSDNGRCPELVTTRSTRIITPVDG